MRVVFLHGVGSPPSVDELQAPLLRVLGEQNVHLDGPLGIVAPFYADLLRNPPESAGPQPEFTYTAPSRDQRAADAEGFRDRQKAMEDRLRGHRDQEPLRSRAPALIKNRMPEVISRGPAGDLRLAFNYRKEEARRHAIWSRVLDSIEPRTPLVLVGHSLGSAIALDLLKRLQGNHVQLLLTLGSPLGAIRLAQYHGVDTVFPYDVLDYWVNIYDALDPVTQGRGLRRHFGQVVDLPVRLQTMGVPGVHQHGVVHYLGHAAIADAIGYALPGEARNSPRTPRAVAIDGWEEPVLRMSYALALAAALPPEDRNKTRIRDARSLAARRFREAHPRAPFRQEDLVDNPREEMRRIQRNDVDLVVDAVMLATSWPVPGFDLLAKPDATGRRQALVDTLAVLRDHEGAEVRIPGYGPSSNKDDGEYADEVLKAVVVASKVIGPKSNQTWMPTAPLALGSVALSAAGIRFRYGAPAGHATTMDISGRTTSVWRGTLLGGLATLSALTSLQAERGDEAESAGDDAPGSANPKRLALHLADQDFPVLQSQLHAWVSVIEAERGLQLDNVLDHGRGSGEVRRTPRACLASLLPDLIDRAEDLLTDQRKVLDHGSTLKDATNKVQLLHAVRDWLGRG